MGDTLTPEGAVHLSWYHSTSAQVFKDMRFLVLKNAEVDLLIGSHSLVKYNLISPPNFCTNVNERGAIIVQPGGMLRSTIYRLRLWLMLNQDQRLQELKQYAQTCKEHLQNLKRERRGHVDKKLEAKIKKAEKKYKIADTEWELNNARKNLEKSPDDKDLLQVVDDIRKRLEELNKKGDKIKEKDKDDGTEKDSAPSVQVHDPNGKVRTPTGLSIHTRPRG